MKVWTRWQDWVTVVLGVILFITPWLFSTTTTASSAWNAWIVGGVAVILALMSLGFPNTEVTEWVMTLGGIWLFISPWVLGFATLASAAWVAWIIGILLIIASGWTVLEERRLHMGVTA